MNVCLTDSGRRAEPAPLLAGQARPTKAVVERGHCPATGRSGFSLVEVMLALAIIAIGLVAIIGMIPQGIQASRDAADNTISATIVHDTFNNIRALAMNPTVTWASLSVPQDIYYDVVATNSTTTPTVDSYFHMRLIPQLTPPYLLVVTAVVTWPDKGTGVSPLNTSVFVTEIANYQK
jgi:uncharacterized protein (TIGR02598 family)